MGLARPDRGIKLQCGHDTEVVETAGSATRRRTPSMSFNVATTQRSWKPRRAGGSHLPPVASMWPRHRGRGNMGDVADYDRLRKASMWPRHRGRGNAAEAGDLAEDGDASMWPRHRGRG